MDIVSALGNDIYVFKGWKRVGVSAAVSCFGFAAHMLACVYYSRQENAIFDLRTTFRDPSPRYDRNFEASHGRLLVPFYTSDGHLADR